MEQPDNQVYNLLQGILRSLVDFREMHGVLQIEEIQAYDEAGVIVVTNYLLNYHLPASNGERMAGHLSYRKLLAKFGRRY